MKVLKPCPFCGSTHIAERYDIAWYNPAKGLSQNGYVECKECEASSGWVTHTDKEHGGQEGLAQAVRDSWNKRV